MKMNVATSLNEAYVPYTYVMLYSLFKNNEDHEITVHLLTDGLSEESKKHLGALCARYKNHLIYLTVSREVFDKRLYETGNHPVESCFRLALNDLLPQEVDRLLYLDGDIVVNKDVAPLYTMNFRGGDVIACHDMDMTRDSVISYGDLHSDRLNALIENNKYFNSGVMLMNSAKLRSTWGLRDYLAIAMEVDFKLELPDQDLLNLAHGENTVFVDEWNWNLFGRNAHIRGYDKDSLRRRVSIVHFAGDKPWNGGNHYHYRCEGLWWDYALQTGYSDSFLERFIGMTLQRTRFREKARDMARKNIALRENITTVMRNINSFSEIRRPEDE
ncbi:MAG: glycosyltransferase family 8 protein [Eubacterium sp.]|nr:glycosyltransferase family 8 protein [Eubacterium sp.]